MTPLIYITEQELTKELPEGQTCIKEGCARPRYSKAAECKKCADYAWWKAQSVVRSPVGRLEASR